MLALQQDLSGVREFYRTPPQAPAIALLPWGNVLEDFLDTIGISLETFCNEFAGSWMFGYADALRQVGLRTVLICISSGVTVPSRVMHVPTGATICLLPRLGRAMELPQNLAQSV